MEVLLKPKLLTEKCLGGKEHKTSFFREGRWRRKRCNVCGAEKSFVPRSIAGAKIEKQRFEKPTRPVKILDYRINLKSISELTPEFKCPRCGRMTIEPEYKCDYDGISLVFFIER